MHFMFLSCYKATELIEKKLYFKLSFKERLRLKVHTAMCSACSNYEKQSGFLDKALNYDFKPTDLHIDLHSFKEETKAKISKPNLP